jgi:hypothetical protein
LQPDARKGADEHPDQGGSVSSRGAAFGASLPAQAPFWPQPSCKGCGDCGQPRTVQQKPNVPPVSEPDEGEEHIVSSSSLHKWVHETGSLFLKNVNIDVLLPELYGKIKKGKTADIYDVYSMINVVRINKRFKFDMYKKVWVLMNTPNLYSDHVRSRAVDALWTCFNRRLAKEQMDLLFKETKTMLSFFEELKQQNILEGIQKGRLEGVEKTALMFIINGYDLKNVSEVTGIPTERLEELVEGHKLSSKPQEDS